MSYAATPLADPAMMIGIAFVFGYAGRLLGLPPLVGFLGAGFLLRGVGGVEFTPEIGMVADLGVTLMLFTIGLKLRLDDLMKTPVWAGATLHLSLTVGGLIGLLLLGGSVGIPMMRELTLPSAAVVAFALAFSSTVFAVVMFQQKGEEDSAHAKLAIGILVMQDIFAVMFLTASKGVVPTWGAIPVLLGLIFGRKLLCRMLQRAGHGELLMLMGLLLPIGVAQLFEIVNLKGDLGALLLGMVLASSRKRASSVSCCSDLKNSSW